MHYYQAMICIYTLCIFNGLNIVYRSVVSEFSVRSGYVWASDPWHSLFLLVIYVSVC